MSTHTSICKVVRSLSISGSSVMRLRLAGLFFLATAVSGHAQTAAEKEGEADPAPVAQPEITRPSMIPLPQPDEEPVITLDALQVGGTILRNSAADMLRRRKTADVAIDFVTTEQMTKFGAGDIAEVIIRIPGVSVAGGQFAVIRGLSDRYTNTTLNGLKIPSPDPEKQSPQLDILPTTLIDSVVVSKSFVPYLWADTSGGSIDLTTQSYPEERRLSVSYGLKVNDNARYGGPRYRVTDNKYDWRAQGSRIRPTSSELQEPHDFVPQHVDLPIGQKLALNYGQTFLMGDSQLGANASFFYEVSSDQRAGQRRPLYLQHKGAQTPSNSEYRTGIPTLLGVNGTWDYEETKVEVATGLLANLGFQFNPLHKVGLSAFWTRTGADTTQASVAPMTDYTWVDPNNGETVVSQVAVDQGEYRLNDYSSFVPNAVEKYKDVQNYVERKLAVAQLSGEHSFPSWADLSLTWVAQQASTYQNEPNFIEAPYYRQSGLDPDSPTNGSLFIPIGLYGIKPQGTNLKRFWNDTHEGQDSLRFDFILPFTLLSNQESRLKFGAAREDTDRDFEGSNWISTTNPLTEAQRTDANPDDPFQQLVRRGPAKLATNKVAQSRNIDAAYVSVDFALPANLQLIGGARLEKFSINTSGKDSVGSLSTATGYLYHYSAYTIFSGVQYPEFGTSSTLPSAHVTNVLFEEEKWYSSLALTYKPTSKIIARASASRTSGRPSLRELAPYYNRSIETGDYVVGNPFLKTSEVTNADARLEWYPAKNSRLAVSIFAKKIKNPIEKLYLAGILNGESTETWSNNPNTADLMGAELEFSQNLGDFTSVLTGFTLGGNFTWIEAEVEEHPEVLRSLRARGHLAADPNLPGVPSFSTGETITRRLYDQPDYIANLDLTWSNPRSGTSVVVAFTALGAVLEASGGGTIFVDPFADRALVSLDIYQRSSHRLDVSLTQLLREGLKLKFGVRNLTDPERGTIYDPERTSSTIVRNVYRTGPEYSLSITQTF